MNKYTELLAEYMEIPGLSLFDKMEAEEWYNMFKEMEAEEIEEMMASDDKADFIMFLPGADNYPNFKHLREKGSNSKDLLDKIKNILQD